jgi:hypothetical protein
MIYNNIGCKSDLTTLDKFKSQFPVYLYNDFSEVESVLSVNENIDAVYWIQSRFI